MGKAMRKPWTVPEFVAWEERQVERYEFVDGIVRMITGGTAAHSTIITNLVVALRSALRGGPCRPLVDTPKVVTAFASLYPDVAVVCRPVEPGRTTLDEPTIIIEVLSPSTEGEDRGGKWTAHHTLPSLTHYLLVIQNEARVELFTRDGDGWRFQVFTGLDALVGAVRGRRRAAAGRNLRRCARLTVRTGRRPSRARREPVPARRGPGRPARRACPG